MWTANRFSMPGIDHVQNNIMCEDYSFAFSSGNATAVSVADGAGSAAYGAKGAMVAAKTAARYIAVNFDKIFDGNNDERAKYFITESVIQQICAEFETNDIKEYSSTILCAAESRSRYIAVHLGDGIICTMNDKNEIDLLSAPMNGLTRKQTFLTGMTNAYKNMRLYKGSSENIKAIMLFSDGLAADIFNVNDGKVKDNFNSEKFFADKDGAYIKSFCTGEDDCSCAYIKKV